MANNISNTKNGPGSIITYYYILIIYFNPLVLSGCTSSRRSNMRCTWISTNNMKAVLMSTSKNSINTKIQNLIVSMSMKAVLMSITKLFYKIKSIY